MTPEEFNKEFARLESHIGFNCPAPIKKAIWAKCKDRPVEFLKTSLQVYKFCWTEDLELEKLKKRHRYS